MQKRAEVKHIVLPQPWSHPLGMRLHDISDALDDLVGSLQHIAVLVICNLLHDFGEQGFHFAVILFLV